jgi:hypothetical protein
MFNTALLPVFNTALLRPNKFVTSIQRFISRRPIALRFIAIQCEHRNGHVNSYTEHHVEPIPVRLHAGFETD